MAMTPRPRVVGFRSVGCAVALATLTAADIAAQTAAFPQLPAHWAREIGLAGAGSLARSNGVFARTDPLTLDQLQRPLGMSWFAGNPAALPWEVTVQAAELEAGHHAASGEYRRPLDSERQVRNELRGIAWGVIDDRRAARGSARVGTTVMQPGANSLALAPYAGNPFLSTDAERPDLRTIDAAFDGALGIRFGAWSLGVGAVYTAAEQRTVSHTMQRYLRDTDYVATAGAVRALGAGGLKVGVHGRAGAGAAVNGITTLTAGTEVRTLIGYTEPEPVVVGLPGSFYRRTNRSFTDGTLSVSSTEARIGWILFASLGTFSERMTRQPLAAPEDPREEWAVQRMAFGGGITASSRALGGFMLLARHERETGTGTIPDVGEAVFTTADDHVRASLTWLPPGLSSTLRAALHGGVEYVGRAHNDRLSTMSSDLTGWTTTAGAEGVWSPREHIDIAVGYNMHFYQPSGRLPAPHRFGTATHDLVARELGYYFTAATTHALGAALTWRTRGAELTLHADVGRAAAEEAQRRYDIHPRGSRTATTVGLRFRPDSH